MKIHVYPQGSRVRVRQGNFPIDPAWIDRTGIVVKVDEYHPERYGVVFDGESVIRELTVDTLEAIEPGASPERAGDAGDASR